MAVRHAGLAERVVVWARRAAAREECLGADWCAAAHADLAAAVAGADIVVLCMPVDAMPGVLAALHPHLDAGALVTDVGSVKGSVCAAARTVFGANAGPVFVGSHPMAGSEKGGLAHASAGLFTGQACFVTEDETVPLQALERVVGFWEAVGMRVQVVGVEAHDQIVAQLSHLPHLLASQLCAQLAEKPMAWRALAGAGLRDTTRVAAGAVPLWNAIIRENRVAVAEALADYETRLRALRGAVEQGDWAALDAVLAQGKAYREGL